MLQRSACAQRAQVPQRVDAAELEAVQFRALHQRAKILDGAARDIQELKLIIACERAQVPDSRQSAQLEMLQGAQR